MIRSTKQLLLGSMFMILSACGGEGEDASLPADTADPEQATAADADLEHDHDVVAAGDAHEALPLRPIMQGLASDLAGFSYALWLEDYDEMTARAAAIAEHAHISPEEIARIEAELGPEMEAFEGADETVHLLSVRLHEAAQARQLDVVLETLSEVQRGCMTCHIRFRDRLRTDTIVSPDP